MQGGILNLLGSSGFVLIFLIISIVSFPQKGNAARYLFKVPVTISNIDRDKIAHLYVRCEIYKNPNQDTLLRHRDAFIDPAEDIQRHYLVDVASVIPAKSYKCFIMAKFNEGALGKVSLFDFPEHFQAGTGSMLVAKGNLEFNLFINKPKGRPPAVIQLK